MPKILVVDDEETLCEALRFNLEKEGYIVDTALSAEEALTYELSGYSLILLDIMMGDISGLQLASILRKRETTSHIPIIFCTAKDSEDRYDKRPLIRVPTIISPNHIPYATYWQE